MSEDSLLPVTVVVPYHTQREQSGRSPVRRAMGNLKMAVMQRLNDGEADQATVDAVIDIIDAAARKVERL